MPFPIVYGIPKGTPKGVLHRMRELVISTVADAMGIPPKIVRPFFPTDLIGDPDEGQDDTIFVTLDTGMFLEGPNNALEVRKRVTQALAQVIWDTFEGRYEVEVFIGDLDGEGKTILPARR